MSSKLEYVTKDQVIEAIYESDPFGVRKCFGWRAMDIEEALRAIPAVDVEKISDGYHTFADLYEQRLILSAALAKNNPHAWKSKRHEDGSVPFGGGWFIMGFDTDEGCYTYHYELKDWDLFQCKELDKGKPWDGHTSKDVRRLLSIPAAVSVPQWISVKDKLPEDGEHVLIWYEYYRYGSYNRMYTTYEIAYQYNGHWTGAGDSLGQKARVFAWRPLPKPPKGENDG